MIEKKQWDEAKEKYPYNRLVKFWEKEFFDGYGIWSDRGVWFKTMAVSTVIAFLVSPFMAENMGPLVFFLFLPTLVSVLASFPLSLWWKYTTRKRMKHLGIDGDTYMMYKNIYDEDINNCP